MLLALALTAAALAYPKAYSEIVVLLAVAPDGHHVLLGTLGSFDQRPHGLVERDVATGFQRPPNPAVVAAFQTCAFDAPCDALDAAWIPGAWIAWSETPIDPTWILSAQGADGWDTQFASAPPFSRGAGWWADRVGDAPPSEEDRLIDGNVSRGDDWMGLQALAGALHLTLQHGERERSVQFSRARLDRLGVSAGSGGIVAWGTEGVLVAFAGQWASEGEAMEPVMAFVLRPR